EAPPEPRGHPAQPQLAAGQRPADAPDDPQRDRPPPVLEYQTPRPITDDALARVHANGTAIAVAAAIVGVLISVIYGIFYDDIHRLAPRDVQSAPLVMAMGVATVLRLASDPNGAVLQFRGRIALDNALLTLAEAAWLALFVASSLDRGTGGIQPAVYTYLAAAVVLYSLRHRFVVRHTTDPTAPRRRDLLDAPTIGSLLSYGLLITLAQLADFLYAPVDYILIDALLGWRDLAAYAPAVQIDAALLILVAGLASVLLPRAALAHAQGPAGRATVWRYYLRGTLASAGLLAVAGIVVWFAAPLLFKLWLGDPMPATQAILPLVLIHTVAGGSSAVGRSILLATGHAKAFTLSVLIAGVANVVLSYCFVRYLNLGLPGIVLGTITVVTARCALWMPWYVHAALQRDLDNAQTNS
ncbi:MAG: lipopolysaccharide biosynthesis protein, partial [Phycisphaerae bacterium]